MPEKPRPGKTLDSLLDALSGGSLSERLNKPATETPEEPTTPAGANTAPVGGISDLLAALGGPEPAANEAASAPPAAPIDDPDDPFAALDAKAPVRVEDPEIAARAQTRLASRSEADSTERLAALGESGGPAVGRPTSDAAPRAGSLGAMPKAPARREPAATPAAAQGVVPAPLSEPDDPFAALLPTSPIMEPPALPTTERVNEPVAERVAEPVAEKTIASMPKPNAATAVEARHEPATPTAAEQPAPPVPHAPEASAAAPAPAVAMPPAEEPRWARTGRRPAPRPGIFETPEVPLVPRPVVPAASQPAAPLDELRASSGDGETRIIIRTASERKLERVRTARGGGWTRRREQLRNLWEGPLGWRGRELEEGVIARAMAMRMGLFFGVLALAIGISTFGAGASWLPARAFDAAGIGPTWSRGIVELVATDRQITLASGQTSSIREIREIREGYAAFMGALRGVFEEGADLSTLAPYATERGRSWARAY